MSIHSGAFLWDLAILVICTGSLALLLLCALALRRKRHESEWGRNTDTHVAVFPRVFGILSFLILLTVLYGAVVEPRMIVVTERTVPFPYSKPLTIAVVSDFHVGPYKGTPFLQRVVKRINDLHPDLVFLAGDFLFDGSSSPSDLAPFKDLLPSIGTYAVLGNYDTSNAVGNTEQAALVDTLNGMNVHVLRDASITARTSGGPLGIAGVRDVRTEGADPGKAFGQIPAGTPTILIAHNPDIILDWRSLQAKLIISGHTHGGQVRLPFYGPIPPLPTRLGRKYDQGTFTLTGGTVLAITRGVGETASRVRLFAPPEILLLRTVPGS